MSFTNLSLEVSRDAIGYATLGALTTCITPVGVSAGMAAVILGTHGALTRIIMSVTHPIFNSLGAKNGEQEARYISHFTFSQLTSASILVSAEVLTAAEMASLLIPSLALISLITLVASTSLYLFGQKE